MELVNLDHETDIINLIRLYRSPRVGPTNFRKLIGMASSTDEAVEILSERARELHLDDYKICDETTARKEFDEGQRIGAEFIFDGDPRYPALLREASTRPPFFWAKGNVDLLSQKQIAIVGARNASIEGARMARGLGRDLTEVSYCVVSGLARGIDTSAHEGALAKATIGVVAGGLDILYPKQNSQLQLNIAERGLLVSEMPFGHQPQASNFPQRNRIIAGIASATLVIECTRRSGTMITANDANAMGREVLAIPGHPLNPRSEGPNYLIREGATLVRNLNDILEALGEAPQMDAPPDPPEEPTETTSQTNWAKMGIDEIEGKTLREMNGDVSPLT